MGKRGKEEVKALGREEKDDKRYDERLRERQK